MWAMDLFIFLAGPFAIALLGWFGRAKAAAATGQQPITTKDVFPQSLEVIPRKLRVKIFLHDILNGGETIPCWSYVTDGLVAQHQKEIIFTVRRENGQRPEDYPRAFFELFEIIFHLSEKGQLVDVGGRSLFSEAGFQGNKDIRGIGYMEPRGFLGVETGGVPLLAAILLMGDEAQIAWDVGLTRVTALIGMKYRFYPCPTWSELKREAVASLHDMDKSRLGRITRIGIRGSYYEEQNHIFLSIFPSSGSRIREFLCQRPPTEGLALCTEPDYRANACLVWRPGQDQPMAITPPGSNGSRKTGAFLAFVPKQEANEVQMVEDGFFFLLTDTDWQKIREALVSGSDIFIPPGGRDGASISIEWEKEKGYVSPIEGETYFAERWTTYQPEGNSREAKQRVAVSSSRIILLTTEHELAARTTAEGLGEYINRIEDAVDALFTPQSQRTRCELTIQLALTQDGHKVRYVAVPDLSADMEGDLSNRLENVPAPKVGGPVKLELILTVWGFAGNQ